MSHVRVILFARLVDSNLTSDVVFKTRISAIVCRFECGMPMSFFVAVLTCLVYLLPLYFPDRPCCCGCRLLYTAVL